MFTKAIRKSLALTLPLLGAAALANADTISAFQLGNATGALTGTNGAIVESGTNGSGFTLVLGVPFSVANFFTPILEPCTACANNTYTTTLSPAAFTITDSTLSQTVSPTTEFVQTFTDTVSATGQKMAAGSSTSAIFTLKNGDTITVTPQANASPGNVAAIFLLSAPTPEPSSWILMLGAVGGLVIFRATRRRSSVASSETAN